MKAIDFEPYGLPDVLKIVEYAKPVLKEDELLIRVRALTVNPAGSPKGAHLFLSLIAAFRLSESSMRIGRWLLYERSVFQFNLIFKGVFRYESI